jgi:hypothetical protein
MVCKQCTLKKKLTKKLQVRLHKWKYHDRKRKGNDVDNRAKRFKSSLKDHNDNDDQSRSSNSTKSSPSLKDRNDNDDQSRRSNSTKSSPSEDGSNDDSYQYSDGVSDDDNDVIVVDNDNKTPNYTLGNSSNEAIEGKTIIYYIHIQQRQKRILRIISI